MSDGAGLGLVERAGVAAARGEWNQAFDLLMEADADGLLTPSELPVLGEVAYAAGHLGVTIEAWERAYAACLQIGEQVAAGGAAVRVAMHLLFDTALMAPVRGWLARAERLLEGQGETSAHAWLAVVRTYERMLTGDLPDARRWARRAIEVGVEVRPGGVRHWTGGRGPAAHLGRRRPAGSRAARRSRGGDCLRGPRSALDGSRVLRARVRPAGPRAVRRGRAVDRSDGAVVRDECDREPARSLPGTPRRDPQAAGIVRRGRESGAHRLRGTTPLPATRARVAAERARTNPTSQGRHLGRARRPSSRLIAPGGIPSRVSRWCIWPKETWPPRLPPSEMPSSVRCGCPQRSDHRTATFSARRCSRRRSRSRSRPATSTGLDRLPTSWSLSPPDSRARRSWPVPPSPEEGCGSPTAMRRARSGPCPKRCDSGTRSARRTRRRTHALASPRPTAPAAASTLPFWSTKRPARSSKGSKPRGRWTLPLTVEHHEPPDEQPVASVNTFRREGDYWTVTFEQHTVRVRDLKGMRYLARLFADPGREFHVLDLVAAETGGRVQVDGRPSDQLASLGVRRRGRDPRRASQGRLPSTARRDRRRHRRRHMLPGTASGPRRPTPNATSSFASSRVRLD